MSVGDRRLAGRVALVSGGSRGIGAAIGQRLARRGADVVITYARDAGAAAAVTETIRSYGVGGEHMRAEAARAALVEAAVQRTVTIYGRVDILVNNAGVSPHGLLTDVSAFSHLNAAEAPTDGTPAGAPNRRALAIAADDQTAKAVATEIYDTIGYDALVGGIDDSWKIGFRQPAFIKHQNLTELKANVAKATRRTR